jgi:hypothetical protein
MDCHLIYLVCLITSPFPVNSFYRFDGREFPCAVQDFLVLILSSDSARTKLSTLTEVVPSTAKLSAFFSLAGICALAMNAMPMHKRSEKTMDIILFNIMSGYPFSLWGWTHLLFRFAKTSISNSASNDLYSSFRCRASLRSDLLQNSRALKHLR